MQYMFYRIKYKLQSFPKEVKWFFQKLFRGYSDVEIWNLETSLSRPILKKLKAFKNSNRHGYPKDLTPELWESILDEMINGFTFLYEEGGITKEYQDFLNKKWDSKFNEIKVDVSLEEEGNKLREINNKKCEDAQKGIELFGKYYTNLWD